jgi:acetyl esterase/lipase
MKITFVFILTTLCLAGVVRAQNPQNDPAVPRILYRIPGQEKARVQKDIVYKKAEAAELGLDIYSPAETKAGTMLPAIFFVSGASETKHWNVYKDYGELTAANGMIAVNFNKRFPQGEAGYAAGLEDTLAAIAFVRENASKYGIDKDRIAVWTFSAGGALTVAGLQENQPYVKAVVSYYGVIGMTSRRQVTALGEKLPPMLIVRAGRDSQFINNSIDLFVHEAINKNTDLTFWNYPTGQHAFEIRDDTGQTREILRKTFEFLAEKLK